ncbi:SI1L3 protein, partial [Rhadina sibilatrix]|nr:SI1L3 protein [Rhadina sibilatrix]
MGVRACVAEWPPHPKDPTGSGTSSTGTSTGTRQLQVSLCPAPQLSKEEEFQEGFTGIPLRQRSSSEVMLSECNPEELLLPPETHGGAGSGSDLFREYGSTSSIDVQGIPKQSFFEMLNEFRAKKPQLGKAESHEESAPPPQGKEKVHWSCLKNDESIFKKLRNPQHELGPKEPEEPRGLPEPGKSWIWRKSFAHYDVQSICFEAVSPGTARAQRRNTTTGASAASAGSDPSFSSTEDLNSKENLEQDLGDNTS